MIEIRKIILKKFNENVVDTKEKLREENSGNFLINKLNGVRNLIQSYSNPFQPGPTVCFYDGIQSVTSYKSNNKSILK